MTQKARGDGFSVVSYFDLTNPAPLPSSFLFKTKSNRATLSLKFSFRHPGHNNELTFFLQINPSDLEPSKIFLAPANISLHPDLLCNIQRPGNPQIRTLCLNLARRCLIWYPKCITTAPASGVYPTLDAWVSLATTRTLYVLLDSNWLGDQPAKVLQELVFHPEKFSPFSVEEYYKKNYVPLNWSLFDAPAYCDLTTPKVDPTPPYSGATVKRRRQSSNPPPSPPFVKRLLLSPDPEAIETSIVDEDGTTTPQVKFEHSTGSITRASTIPLTSSPSPGTPRQELRRAVENALEQSLAGRIGNLIPSLVAQLVAAPSPTPSEQSMDSHRSTTPPPPSRLNSFGELLGDYVLQQIRGDLENIHKRTQSHAEFLRGVADDEFHDRLEEERLALGREADAKYEEFKQKCEDLEEQTVERVEWRVNEISEHLEEYEHADDSESGGTADVDGGRAKLNKERAKLRRKAARLRMGAEDLLKEKNFLRMEKEDLWRREAQLRKERKALEKEKQLHAQMAKGSLDKERDSLLPELPECCVLP